MNIPESNFPLESEPTMKELPENLIVGLKILNRIEIEKYNFFVTNREEARLLVINQNALAAIKEYISYYYPQHSSNTLLGLDIKETITLKEKLFELY